MLQVSRTLASAGIVAVAVVAAALWSVPALEEVSAAGQMPSVLNGRVETRPATSLDAAVTAAGTGPDPVWIGWSVPMVIGDRHLCSQWVPEIGGGAIRIATLEGSPLTQAPPARPATPVRLEGGTTLVVLARVVAGRVERLRALDDECPIDAGGRTVYWLTGVSAAESVRYLDALVRTASATTEGQRRIATSAVSAIALHRDPAADPSLDRLVAAGAPDALARHAAMWMGSARGAHGFQTLQARIRAERDPRLRRTLVSALGQTREPATPEALVTLARSDADPGVRAEAVHWYAVRAPEAALPQMMRIIGEDRDDAVKRRAVSSLGVLPADAGVPALIQLARTGPSPVIRKEAVSTLGRSTDARARAFLEELVAR